jgi:hypothetical protein
MTLPNFWIQKSPELPWTILVKTDGTWTATIAEPNAKVGQRTELLQVGEIRQELITVAPINNCEAYTVSGAYAERSNDGVNVGDGVYVSLSTGGGSEMNPRDSGDSPFSWTLPTTNLFGINWCIFLECIADGFMFCAVNSNVAQLAPLTIPTRKLNKPVNVVDQVLSSSQMALVPPNIITRDVGDFTTQVKVRDDVLVQSKVGNFENFQGRVKTVVAGQIDLYAPHNQDTGGNVAGGMVVSQTSDGT